MKSLATICLLLWKFQLGSMSENFASLSHWCNYAYFFISAYWCTWLFNTLFLRDGMRAELLFIATLHGTYEILLCLHSHFSFNLTSKVRTIVYSKERGKANVRCHKESFPMCHSQWENILFPMSDDSSNHSLNKFVQLQWMLVSWSCIPVWLMSLK